MFLDLCSMHFVCVCVHSHQKLASRAKVWSTPSTPTPDFEYSPTHFFEEVCQLQHPILSILQHIFSKKFVVPCRLKGFDQNGFILKNGCGGYLHCKHASPSSWKIALTTHTVMNLDNGTWNLMISPNHSSGQ